MTKFMWMEVTQDKYQLPVAIADTSTELARIRGVTSETISSTISHFKTGRYKKPKYIKVEIDDKDEEYE